MKYIKESPDMIDVGDDVLLWRSTDAVSFGYFNSLNTIIVTEDPHPIYYIGTLNMSVDDFFMENDKKEIQKQVDSAFRYPGRMWVDKKVISFWKYPPKNKFKVFISELQRIYNSSINDLSIDTLIDFTDTEWRIEIIDNGAQVYSGGDSNDQLLKLQDRILIPLGDYQGSGNFSDNEYLQHIMSPLEKIRKEVPEGVGSKKRLDGMKDKEIMAQFRARTSQEMIVTNFSDFLKINE